MAHILLIEDADTLGMSLEMTLMGQGHQVTWCRNLESARHAFSAQPPDLVLLDLGLPDGDGLDFCSYVRAQDSIAPIVVVTARDSLYSRVEGLKAGADDYVTKPFELPELLARIEALLRRQRWHGAGDVVTVGALEVDFRRRQAHRDDQEVALTELEFKLLRYLVDRAGEVVSREELLARVWDQNPSNQTRTVDVFIGRLRRHLETDSSAPTHLSNVRGVGYRLIL